MDIDTFIEAANAGRARADQPVAEIWVGLGAWEALCAEADKRCRVPDKSDRLHQRAHLYLYDIPVRVVSVMPSNDVVPMMRCEMCNQRGWIAGRFGLCPALCVDGLLPMKVGS